MRSARSDGTFDPRQFKAMVRLSFWNIARPALDKTTGKARSRPLRTLVIAYLILGLLFVRNAVVFRDLRSYLIALASYVMTTAMLTLLPDATEMGRAFEIVCAKPIGARTMAVARAGSILLMQAILVGSLAAIPVFAVHLIHGASLLVPALLIPSLLLGSFTASMFWLSAMMFLARRLRLDRLRWASQVLLGVVVLGLSLPLLMPQGVVVESIGRIDLGSDALRLLPPVWLVDTVVGDLSLYPNLERLALLFSVAAMMAVLLTIGGGTSYADMLERALQSGPLVERLPRTARFVRRLPAGLFSRRAKAIATLIIAHATRDEVGRRRLFPLRLMLLILAGFDMFTFHVGAPVTTILGFLILVDGLRVASQSPHAAASWMLESAPIDAKEALAAIRLAVASGYFALPYAVTSVLLFLEHPLRSALLSSAAYAMEADIVLSFAVALDPSWPLSKEEQKMPPIVGRFAYMLVFAFLVGLRSVLVGSPRALAVELAFLALLAWAARRFVERRFLRKVS